MDPVKAQYEAYPYPERDPRDEARRLIEGSPSHPVEIDHFLFAGRRDWSQPFRALVAGGGTGDGLVMLAQRLADIGCPAEITYLDLSEASRRIAEARVAARKLGNVRFVTGDLMAAPEFGPFDYIDCCGVLHHLPDPDAGFRALADALAPDGGIGLMVYAPHGRTGVYALQSAFASLFGQDDAVERVRLARAAIGGLPSTNWFRRNDLLGDHRASDAGLHDLLLNARDRAYGAAELLDTLDQAGLALAGWVAPGRYDPLRYLPRTEEMRARVAALGPRAAAAAAEQLAGNIKAHVAYAIPAGAETRAPGAAPDAVPHLARVRAQALAKQVAARGGFALSLDGLDFSVEISRAAAPLLAGIDGRRSLGDIAKRTGRDWIAFAGAWAPVERVLVDFNLVHYSRGARR